MGPPGWKGRVDDPVYRRTSMLRWPHGRENKPNLHETNDGGKKKTSLPKGLGRHSHGIKFHDASVHGAERARLNYPTERTLLHD